VRFESSSERVACPGVSILNCGTRTGVAEANLSQNGPLPRWKRPAHDVDRVAGVHVAEEGQRQQRRHVGIVAEEEVALVQPPPARAYNWFSRGEQRVDA
jgi:hypothetical protein